MDKVASVSRELRKSKESLSKKAVSFLEVLQESSGEKAAKLTGGILYETLTAYKDKKDPSASYIIDTCIQYLISDWKTTGISSVSHFPAYLKAAVKRLCHVENDLVLLKNVGWSIVMYLPLRENSEDEASKWFLHGVSQVSTSDAPCSCGADLPCAMLVAFELELQASLVKSYSRNEVDKDSLSVLLSAVERHFAKFDGTEQHILKIAHSSVDLLKKATPLISVSTLEPLVCVNMIMDVIIISGFVKLGNNDTQDYFQKFHDDLKRFQKTLRNDTVHSQCLITMNHLVTIFARYCEPHIDLHGSCVKCINDLYSTSRTISIELLAKMAYFFQKVVTVKNVEIILKLLQQIFQNQDLDFEITSDYCLKIMGSIIRISMLVVNEVAINEHCEIVDYIIEKLLKYINREKYSEDSKWVPIILNSGAVLAKVRRKLQKYFSAMLAAEDCILLIPFESSLPLIDQWVKAKCNFLNSCNNSKDSNQISTRTLATGLEGKVPEKFLIKILLRELELYVSLDMEPSELFSICEKLLHFDHSSLEGHKSLIAYHSAKAQFDIGESSIDFIKFYELCGDDDNAWEHIIQIKNIEFLEKWNDEIKNKFPYEQLDSDLQELTDIHCCLEEAALTKHKLRYLENTAKVAHEASAASRLFGNHYLALKIMGCLWNLLKVQPKSRDSKDDQPKLWNICSALCEMSSCYMQLQQVDSAEKYAKEAASTWKAYFKCVSNAATDAMGAKNTKLLFLKVQSMQAEIFNIQGQYIQAIKTIDDCLADDYFSMDNLKKSISVVYNSCVVLMAASRVLERPEVQIPKQLSFFKRISSLVIKILPHLHRQEDSMTEDQAFGKRSAGIEYKLRMQLNVVIYLLENLQQLSLSYILIGDPKQAAAYIQTGLTHAKYLRLKHWYLRFSLLRLKVLSMLGDEQFSKLSENFCEAVVCKCTAEKSWVTADCSVLDEDTEDEFDVDVGEESDSEMAGSADDDAILIPTKKIDILNANHSYKDSASPRLKKNTRLKSPSLDFLRKKTCHCSSASDFESSIRYEFAAIYANSFLNIGAVEEGIKVCDLALDMASKCEFEKVDSTLQPIKKEYFWSHVIADISLSKAKLLLQRDERKCAIMLCKEAIETIDKSAYSNTKSFILKAELYVLLSYAAQAAEKPKIEIHGTEYLNAIIDAIAEPKDSGALPNIQTPVRRTRKRALTQKNAPSTQPDHSKSTRKLRTKNKFTAESKENFEIYQDNQSLPVPQLDHNRSRSPQPSDVYDIDKPEVQNIKLSRQAAAKQHRNKFGTLITDESKERVRGRTVKSKKTTKIPKLQKKTVPERSEIHPDHEDSISNFGKALEYSSTVGDFFTLKTSVQELSKSYFLSYLRDGDEKKKEISIAFHLSSIGIPMRWSIQMYESIQSKSASDNSGKMENDELTPLGLPRSYTMESPYCFQSLLENGGKYIEEVRNLLPANWTVCVVSLASVLETSTIILTRIRAEEEVFHTQVCAETFQNILSEFKDIMNRNAKALKSREVSYWWTQRRILNNELKSFTNSLSAKVLKHYMGLLLGVPLEDGFQKRLNKAKEDIAKKFPFVKNLSSNLDILINSWHLLSVEQKLAGILDLCGKEITKEHVISLAKELEWTSRDLKLNDATRGHVILILDKDVQLLPWESTPLLQGCSVTRLPSIDLLKCQLLMQKLPDNEVVNKGVNLKDVSYILNPNGDLKKSEERFQKWFQSMKSWKGIISREPDQNEWLSSITDFDLFIYCGHGSGTKYISSKDFLKVKTRAAALLMGCGSAKLDQEGVFEPNGIVLQYLMTGSPCIVGCLWKVTDKDIDSYLCKLIEHWAGEEKPPISVSAVHARQGMKMQYINGAACVIYGLPIHCQATTAKFLRNLPKI